MMKRGTFEIAYAPETPEGITVRIEPGEDGDVWMTVNDITKAYGVFYQTVRAELKALKKSGDFDEYQDVRIEKFLYKVEKPRDFDPFGQTELSPLAII